MAVETPPAPAPAPTLPPQAIDPLSPPAPKPMRPEDDPNHLIAQMIANRGEKKEDKPAAKADDKPADPTDSTDAPKKNPELGDLISKTLGFRTRTKEKPPETPAAPAAEPAKPDPAPEKPKSIVSKRRQSQPAPDAVSIATAAATAAVKAVTAGQPQAKPAPAKEVALKDEDQHEYEVAKYLGTINPKYKDAEKVVLEHVRKAESYAERWEKENPGKSFDPDDDEHNEFYAAMEKPWSDHEFRMAENEIAAERVASRKEKGSQAKLDELTQSSARLELKPIANQTLYNAATELAKGLGDGVLENIHAQGLEKFAEADPITANALSEVLTPLHPLIEAIIEIDDLKGRIPYDGSNPNHVAWSNLLFEKEQQYVGVTDGGKLFATRAEMHALSPAERKNRFYLTADHLVAELVADATELAKERIKTKREEIEKAALAMGFTKPSGKVDKSNGTLPTNGKPADTNVTQSQPSKPVSPSDNGSPRIDTPAGGFKNATDKALAATAGILFQR